MRVLWIVVTSLGVLALASTAAAADLELGKKVFAAKCASCHGPDGKGNAKMSEMLKVNIPHLSDSAGKSDAELLKLLAEGKKPMPSFAKALSKDEMESVLSYTKALVRGSGGK